MEAIHVWAHQTLGMCVYTLPALVLGVIMIIVGLLHWRNQDKREAEFERNMTPIKEKMPEMAEVIPDPAAGEAEEDTPEDEDNTEEDEEV